MLISIVFLLHAQITLSSHFYQTLYTYGTTYLQRQLVVLLYPMFKYYTQPLLYNVLYNNYTGYSYISYKNCYLCILAVCIKFHKIKKHTCHMMTRCRWRTTGGHMHTHTHALVYALKSSNCSFTTVMSYKQHILVLILLSVFSRKCCMFIYFWYSYACMPQGCWQTYAPPINQDKMNMFHVQDLVSKATQWDTISRLHGVGGYTQRTHSTCTALGLHTKYAFYLHGVGLHTKYTLYVF